MERKFLIETIAAVSSVFIRLSETRNPGKRSSSDHLRDAKMSKERISQGHHLPRVTVYKKKKKCQKIGRKRATSSEGARKQEEPAVNAACKKKGVASIDGLLRGRLLAEL